MITSTKLCKITIDKTCSLFETQILVDLEYVEHYIDQEDEDEKLTEYESVGWEEFKITDSLISCDADKLRAFK